MFQVFGSGGARCARCNDAARAGAAYCARCGMALGAPRHEAILRNNRWMPAADELAVFFGVRELSGLFVKTLRVPAAARAYILQGSQATEVPQGEYEIESFFTRLNNLLRDQHAEILVTRTVPLPVAFRFDDLAAADGLAVGADFSVRIKIDQVASFARHFMTMPGVVKTADLAELLAAPVRQIASEFLAAQSVHEMAANPNLRLQFDERLATSLSQLLGDYGLAITGLDTLSMRHLSAGRQAWLAGDGTQDGPACSLQQLCGDGETEGVQGSLQQERARLQPDTEVNDCELALQRAARMQALRVREIELYGRILESSTREDALAKGAAEAVADIEHALAARQAARGNEALEWQHLRELARVRMQGALEAAERDARQQHILAQQVFSHQLQRQQVRYRIEQALEIEDQSHKRAELQALHAARRALQRHGEALEEERRRAALDSLRLAHRVRQREGERVLEWEEQQAIGRMAALARGEAMRDALSREELEQVARRIGREDALALHDKLLRTIDADALHLRAQQAVALEARAALHRQRMEEQEAAWQRELQARAHDIARMQALDRTADTTKLVLAGAANAQALAGYMTTKVHAGMSAPQLDALSGMAGLQPAAGGPPAIRT